MVTADIEIRVRTSEVDLTDTESLPMYLGELLIASPYVPSMDLLCGLDSVA